MKKSKNPTLGGASQLEELRAAYMSATLDSSKERAWKTMLNALREFFGDSTK